jgi:hypothetical protein
MRPVMAEWRMVSKANLRQSRDLPERQFMKPQAF